MALQSERMAKVLILVGAVAAVLLVYSVLILRAPLQWFGIIIPFLFLYLFWRFVLAHERLADAIEGSGDREMRVERAEE
jgi:CHASE2 domain-containing sensor protein